MKLLNKVKISLVLSIGIMLILSIKAFAVTGVITEITVNLREQPSTDSKRIMYVTQDDVVEVLEKNGEWYKIKAKGTIGYVFGEYVKVDEKNSNKEETETVNKEENKQEEVKEVTTNTKEKDKEENKEKIEESKSEIKKEEIQNTNLIIKKNTQIRIVPNISSSVIYTAKKDIQIDIVEQLKDWSYIAISGLHGWVRTDKIVEENEVLPDKEQTTATTKKEEVADKETESSKENEKEELKISYVKYDTVNLRKKPSTSATVIAKLKLNDKVTVLEEENKWSKVKVDEKTGYISTDLLSDKEQEVKKDDSNKEDNTTSRDGQTTSRKETTETDKENVSKKEETTSDKTETTVKKENTSDKKEEIKKEQTFTNKVTGEDIAAYAKKYLGYDYVYGGASPKKGFDCSGLTYYVYKHFGYTLSRSSVAQASNGTKVDKKDLKPGDLVIYKNTALTRIGHVGIYIGNNKMIHASEPGVGVIITDIDAKAYNYPKRYVTARRIIK